MFATIVCLQPLPQLLTHEKRHSLSATYPILLMFSAVLLATPPLDWKLCVPAAQHSRIQAIVCLQACSRPSWVMPSSRSPGWLCTQGSYVPAYFNLKDASSYNWLYTHLAVPVTLGLHSMRISKQLLLQHRDHILAARKRQPSHCQRLAITVSSAISPHSVHFLAGGKAGSAQAASLKP